jgi:DNA-binding LytR/AlgR family response regulator
MKYTYIIIDDNQESILKTKAVASRFLNLSFIASTSNYEDGLNLILEHNPTLVFLEIDPANKESNLSLGLINELYRYLKVIPEIIVITNNKELAYEAMKYEVLDYFIKPLEINAFRKTILKLEKTTTISHQIVTEQPQTIIDVEPVAVVPIEIIDKPIIETDFQEPVLRVIVNEIPVIDSILVSGESKIDAAIISEDTNPTSDSQEVENNEEIIEKKASVSILESITSEAKPLIICVKSYGDYRFIEAKDICYLQADNNSTDIHLYNGEMITAFKTLKHFEGVLASPFVRIHNSYIVNIDYVSRIHTGNSVCYIKNTTIKLPFSKSYKENVDSIINSITNGNYLEI